MNIKEVFETILEYSKVFLSWPVVSFIFFLFFIKEFKESIKVFLKNIASIKVGPFETSQRQGGISEEKIESIIVDETQKSDTDADQIRDLKEKVESNEFAYLSLHLVYNSKFALLWFYNQTSHSSTQINFINQYNLTGQVPNIFAEKEAIFNALLVNDLLEQDGIILKVSKKGIKFLKYLKFIV